MYSVCELKVYIFVYNVIYIKHRVVAVYISSATLLIVFTHCKQFILIISIFILYIITYISNATICYLTYTCILVHNYIIT